MRIVPNVLCRFTSIGPVGAYKWETPVVDTARLGRSFEFVVIESPGLDRGEDQSAFKEFFTNELAVTFSNLGRNAILVVPTPQSSSVNHCHLGSFLRFAKSDAISEVWQKVGIAMVGRVSEKPVWLSTAGGGVPWLHVRLDDRPKYYGYAPYRSES